MPNLKDIRRRIQTVKSTAKITQAMRMVAAAKVKRAENRMKAARPYSQALMRVFGTVLQAVQALPAEELASSPYRFMLNPAETTVKAVGIIAMSSDRGLCGAYNGNVIRQALRIQQALTEQGITVYWFATGTKMALALKRIGANVVGQLTQLSAQPTAEHAATAATAMLELLLKGQLQRIEVLSTHFKSLLSYQVEVTPLLPLALPEAVAENTLKSRSELLFEPNAVSVFDALVPQYVQQTVYRLLLEATASELAARMTAMSNATNNAKDLVSRLTIVYNKVRQAAITQELLEIVAGANALN